MSAPSLSPAANEVLGTLAPLRFSGPHKARLLRRWTRLNPAAYDKAIDELHRTGLVKLERSGILWVTTQGEEAAAQMFS